MLSSLGTTQPSSLSQTSAGVFTQTALLVPEEASAPGRRSTPIDVGGSRRRPQGPSDTVSKEPRPCLWQPAGRAAQDPFLVVPSTELFHVWFSR